MNLKQPTSIKQLSVMNHFIRSATYEGQATPEGYPTEKVKDTYIALAKGDVGTIVTSYTFISDYEQPAKNQLGIYNDTFIEHYQPIVNDVHQYGSKIIMQLVHGSSTSQADPLNARVLGPSAIQHEKSGITPIEMTKEDLNKVKELFVDAAIRAKKANFDGIQIHCAHGYLLAQFISPLFNQRTDEYGGSAVNRIRYVREIYLAIREAVGKDYPIWIKMNCIDEEGNGLTVDEFITMATLLSEDGIDAIEISGSVWRSHSNTERVYYKDAAMRLSNTVETPVILTGGVREYSDVKDIIENSRVSLFGLSRPLIQNTNYIKEFK